VKAVRAAFKAGVTPSRIARQSGISKSDVRRRWSRMNDAVNQMTFMERLAELERQHKTLEREIAEALGQTSTEDLKITELKLRKLMLKDEIERLRHDHAL
jgi:hypothetical protein